MKILFVCTGNTCRSAMCEWYFRFLTAGAGAAAWLDCASAGTNTDDGLPMSGHAKAVLKENGIRENHVSSRITPDLIRAADLVIVMTPGHKAAVQNLVPEKKVHLLLEYSGTPGTPVADPYMQPLDVYRKCFSEMRPALDNLLLDLISERKSTLV